MAKIRVKVDMKGFDPKSIQREVLKMADTAIRAQVDGLQKLVDRLGATHAGRPVSEIKTALRSGWRRITSDGDLSGKQLTDFATAIHDGTKVNIRYDGIK